VVHPFPPDADPNDFETCVAHVARYPAWVLACVIPLWGLASFASVWTATFIAQTATRSMVSLWGPCFLWLPPLTWPFSHTLSGLR
jgi:hypothetical protein